MPDIDLLLWEKVKSGNPEAFELLFRKYYATLCLFAKRYTADMTLAKEVVQDLFVYFWENRNDMSFNSSFKSYLYRAVRFNSIRKAETEKRQGILMDNLPEPDDAEFSDHMELAELQENILSAIECLPEQCKKIFKMSRFDQLKYTEIADALHLSVKTVEAQMSKALKIIHQAIDNKY